MYNWLDLKDSLWSEGEIGMLSRLQEKLLWACTPQVSLKMSVQIKLKEESCYELFWQGRF